MIRFIHYFPERNAQIFVDNEPMKQTNCCISNALRLHDRKLLLFFFALRRKYFLLFWLYRLFFCWTKLCNISVHFAFKFIFSPLLVSIISKWEKENFQTIERILIRKILNINKYFVFVFRIEFRKSFTNSNIFCLQFSSHNLTKKSIKNVFSSKNSIEGASHDIDSNHFSSSLDS